MDDQLEDAELRRMAVKEAQRQENERRWRVAKGLEAPSAPVVAANDGFEREAWMTVLPPERMQPAKINEVSGECTVEAKTASLVEGLCSISIDGQLDFDCLCFSLQVVNRTFSKSGIKSRGDTSSWTDTPEQAAARKQGLIGGGGPSALLALGELRGARHA